jgi:hypothetical protein
LGGFQWDDRSGGRHACVLTAGETFAGPGPWGEETYRWHPGRDDVSFSDAPVCRLSSQPPDGIVHMTQPSDLPPRAINTADVAAQPAKKKRRHWGLIALLVLVILPGTLFALYTWSMLTFVYSSGERSGYVQKIAKKGWVCQTWEGQLALASYPGTTSQMFDFTVRSDSVAKFIESNAAKRLSLTYQQHRGVPSSCFGDTEYFVVGAAVAQ